MAYVYQKTEYEQAQDNLLNVLCDVFPDLSADATNLLYEALVRLVDAKGDAVAQDTYDRVKERGDYRRDY